MRRWAGWPPGDAAGSPSRCRRSCSLLSAGRAQAAGGRWCTPCAPPHVTCRRRARCPRRGPRPRTRPARASTTRRRLGWRRQRPSRAPSGSVGASRICSAPAARRKRSGAQCSSACSGARRRALPPGRWPRAAARRRAARRLRRRSCRRQPSPVSGHGRPLAPGGTAISARRRTRWTRTGPWTTSPRRSCRRWPCTAGPSSAGQAQASTSRPPAEAEAAVRPGVSCRLLASRTSERFVQCCGRS
mmetsp:Transcript_4916/g.14329  ORF Transcript_4916/g.14329 Transcript_4916/m.14329 type:complete len:244 (-) Transcript_4916:685-1416(-)